MHLHNPFLQSQGVELVHWAPGEAEFHMPIEARHLNRQGMLHGGLIATLLDAACGYAGLHAGEGEEELHGVTVMLNIAYLNAARSGTVIARGRVNRQGRSLYFAEASLSSAHGELLATAQGSFKQGGRRHVA
ncbi:ABC transporter substrate-binding protein [Stutzerimonas stutzeri]|uniref:ABC transporter substrate-binding protein n=1 Tax=Stutzerimonas stutzeri TaxID=316 RepID=A0A2N8SXM4_STUST|nr:PaaI family thioesterase [Stutzerimonas stutzeri]MCQ4325569.1 PaaI family thioesterase [Stutzerimonas stutzeri]PNG07234.1 ABC transporter substrate-binding protein [Stutzerimonas stutzeri]